MASVFDANLSDFELTWLRGRDASQLQGAVRGSVELPSPVVLATGQARVAGPSGAVGAGEWWTAGHDLPAMASVAWVLVGNLFSLRADTSGNDAVAMYFSPIGQPTAAANDHYPVYGGNIVDTVLVSNAGFLYATQVTPSWPRTCWLPIDPSDTISGWQALTMSEAPAGGWAASDLRLDLRAIRFLGYPRTAWETGALQEVYAYRGS